jgi:hypothetical protein
VPSSSEWGTFRLNPSWLSFVDFTITMEEYNGTRVMAKRKKARMVSDRILYIVNMAVFLS